MVIREEAQAGFTRLKKGRKREKSPTEKCTNINREAPPPLHAVSRTYAIVLHFLIILFSFDFIDIFKPF